MKKIIVLLAVFLAMFVSFTAGIIVGINSVIEEQHIIVPGTVVERKPNKDRYI